VKVPLQRLEDAAKKVGKLGAAHGLDITLVSTTETSSQYLPGARFSQEFGFMDVSFGDTRGDWADMITTM